MIGNSGVIHEIDILAKRQNKVLAVECKNYGESRLVGIEEIRNFQSKIQDLPQINDALFVTNKTFSSEADTYAKHNQITLWEGEKLKSEVVVCWIVTNKFIICSFVEKVEVLLLNKFRNSLQPMMAKLGMTFASLGLSANFWTTLSLATSLAAGAVYAIAAPTTTTGAALPSIRFSWLYASIIGSVLLLISGFFDIIDGSVARTTKQTSKKGAFLDSSFDKISEAIIFIGIAVGNLSNPILCMIGLSLSIIVSYVRARAESLGIELEGIGIGERAERLLIIAIIGMVPVVGAMQWAIIIVSVVSGLTLIQRIAVISKKL